MYLIRASGVHDHRGILCISGQNIDPLLIYHGIFAVVTKAPQSANPGGCTYGVKIAERNRGAALEILALAEIEILQVVELPGTGERGARR